MESRVMPVAQETTYYIVFTKEGDRVHAQEASGDMDVALEAGRRCVRAGRQVWIEKQTMRTQYEFLCDIGEDSKIRA